MGLRTHEVVAPDMVNMLRTPSHARPIIKPQPASWLLFLWNLQPLTTPDPLDPILVDLPACSSQQSCDPPIAISAMLTGQRHTIYLHPSSELRYAIGKPELLLRLALWSGDVKLDGDGRRGRMECDCASKNNCRTAFRLGKGLFDNT
jgi:hypothetical protein